MTRRLFSLNSSLFSNGISCSRHIANTFTCHSPGICRPALSGHPRLRLFRHTVVGVEAVNKLFAVLVCGMFGKELAVCGALKGLEAGLALDGLGGGVLFMISICALDGRSALLMSKT